MMTLACFRPLLAAVRIKCTPMRLLSNVAPLAPIISGRVPLVQRSVVAVHGRDAFKYLQGMITNDLANLADVTRSAEGGSTLYTMMLNSQGRVLFDAFIYNDVAAMPAEEPGYLLDVDADLAAAVTTHLKRFRLRSKVVIEHRDDLQAWCLVNCPHAAVDGPGLHGGPDPRFTTPLSDQVTSLHRFILPSGVVPEVPGAVDWCRTTYHSLRIGLGIGEGGIDFVPGKSLPLESNLDYTNGVSWTKGCYLGQELTARTYHTGVTRKRLMPITLAGGQPSVATSGTAVTTEQGKSVGVIRSQVPGKALAMIRLAHLDQPLVTTTATGETVAVSLTIPMWWSKCDGGKATGPRK